MDRDNAPFMRRGYGSPMRFLALALLATPALAAHSGVPRVRTGPEPSDIALFVIAAIGIWIVRRAMRRRFTRPPKD